MKLLKLLVPVTIAAFVLPGCTGKKDAKDTTKTATDNKCANKECAVKVDLKSPADVTLNKPVKLELAVSKDGKELGKDAKVEVTSPDGKKATATFDEAKKVFVANAAAPSKEGDVEYKVNVTASGETTAQEATVKVTAKKS